MGSLTNWNVDKLTITVAFHMFGAGQRPQLLTIASRREALVGIKVLVQTSLVTGDVEELRRNFPEVEIVASRSDEEVPLLIGDADIFFGILSPEIYAAAKKLKWLQALSAGVEWLADIPGVVDTDLIVTNTRGAHAQTIGEHTFALILTLTRRMKTHLHDQETRAWNVKKYIRELEGLAGKTMGIVGLGQIGSAIVRRAHGFEMDIYAVDAVPFPHEPHLRGRWGLDRTDELCSIADFLVISAPLTPDSRGLIDARRLGLMKQSAYVIAVSRGNIVDEQALIAALQEGRLAGAGLDVTAIEPLPDDSPLWSMENVVITPHNSPASDRTFDWVWRIFVENLSRYVNGTPLFNIVNKRAGY